MFSKSIIYTAFLLTIGLLSANNIDFNINRLNGESLIKIRHSDGTPEELVSSIISDTKLSIFTGTDSDAELSLFIGDIPLCLIFMKKGTDADIFFSAEDILTINSNFGDLRIVNAKINIHIKTNKMQVYLKEDSDASFSQSILNSNYIQEIAIFHGNATYTEPNTTGKRLIIPLEKIRLTGKKTEAFKLSEDDINNYRKQFSFNEVNIDHIFSTYLETLSLYEVIEEQVTTNKIQSTRIMFDIETIPPIEKLKKEKTDLKKEKKNKEPKEKDKDAKSYIKEMLLDLVTFEGAFIYESSNMNARIGWFPEIESLGEKFLMSFSFDFIINPIKLSERRDPFYKLNGNNNEWSFGYEHIDNPAAMVFDIIEDLSLKTNEVKFGYNESPFRLRAGNIKAKNDFASLRFFTYSPNQLMPFYRSTSFDIQYTYLFFQGSFYAENVATGGLFDLSLKFMTPSENFRVSGESSFTLETHDLRKSITENNYEAIAPFNLDNIVRFTIFNLPSFGYDLYAGFGFLFPFTVNNQNLTSAYDSIFAKNPESILHFIHGSIGQAWRFLDVTLSADTFINSRFAKITQYSPNYFLLRENYFSELHNWYNNSLSEKTSPINDLVFGVRAGITYSYKESVELKIYYFPGFTTDIKNFTYNDQFLFYLHITNGAEKKIPVHFYLTIDFDDIVSNITKNISTKDYISIFNNLFISSTIDIHFPGQAYIGGSFLMLPSFVKNSGNMDINAQFYIGFNYKKKSVDAQHDLLKSNL